MRRVRFGIGRQRISDHRRGDTDRPPKIPGVNGKRDRFTDQIVPVVSHNEEPRARTRLEI